MNETTLIIGGGGREDALRWALTRHNPRRRVLCAPGNGGTPPQDRRNVKVTDFDGIIELAKKEKVSLVVIGPERPAIGGLADRLRENGIATFGASQPAAKLEGSKIFAKTHCVQWGVPTGPFEFTADYAIAEGFIKQNGYRVIKADGDCEGKGVVVADTEEEACEAAHNLLVKKIHGKAGERILTETRLVGDEASVEFLTDGENAILWPEARDYKRVLEGNKGANTGGMGVESPLGDVSPQMLARIKERTIIPTLRGMMKLRTPFQGLLYAGMMLTKDEEELIEFNVRWGDPEAQGTLARVESDIYPYLLGCTRIGGLAKLGPLQVSANAAVAISLVSRGYPTPGGYTTGHPITGLGDLPEDILAFHAGTEIVDGKLVSSGGRVMTIVGLGPTKAHARARALVGAEIVSFENKFYRRDIAA